MSYEERIETLIKQPLVIWDVLQSVERYGSSDSGIIVGSEEPNDFDAFFRANRQIRAVFFNGRKAEELYRSLVVPTLLAPDKPIEMVRLPSTSPANTHLTKERKLEKWRQVIEVANG